VVVSWEVVGLTEFESWFLGLDEASRARVEDRIDFLEQLGPALGRPTVGRVKASRHQNMKELRTGSIRILFIFDPSSAAVLLLGGDKRGNWSGWYEVAIPKADDLYDAYLAGPKE
jgi:hypothetical protein